MSLAPCTYLLFFPWRRLLLVNEGRLIAIELNRHSFRSISIRKQVRYRFETRRFARCGSDRSSSRSHSRALFSSHPMRSGRCSEDDFELILVLWIRRWESLLRIWPTNMASLERNVMLMLCSPRNDGQKVMYSPWYYELEAMLISSPTLVSGLAAGAFKDEIVPITLPSRKKGAVPEVFSQDEHPRPQATLESLAKLPAVFAKGGVVTAANASGICDGAAANVVVSEEALSRYGLKPLARILSYHVVAVEPTIMG